MASRSNLKPWKYKLAQAKAYWETGYGLTHYIKYPLAIFGFATANWTEVVYLGILYFFFCFFFGYMWYKTHMIDAVMELSNQHNPYVQEMREKFK